MKARVNMHGIFSICGATIYEKSENGEASGEPMETGTPATAGTEGAETAETASDANANAGTNNEPMEQETTEPATDVNMVN